MTSITIEQNFVDTNFSTIQHFQGALIDVLAAIVIKFRNNPKGSQEFVRMKFLFDREY